MVGDLSGGVSTVTFFILNATDTTSDPSYVPATLLVAGFTAASVQEVGSYPVSEMTYSLEWSFISSTQLLPGL